MGEKERKSSLGEREAERGKRQVVGPRMGGGGG